MQSVLRVAALAAAASLCLGVAPAQAHNSVNLDGYCRAHYGEYARAIVLDPHDAYSWRCQRGTDLFSISVDQACSEQYGGEYSAVMEDRRDAYSWSCEVGD